MSRISRWLSGLWLVREPGHGRRTATTLTAQGCDKQDSIAIAIGIAIAIAIEITERRIAGEWTRATARCLSQR